MTQVERLAKKLGTDTRNALGRATAEALNRTAFAARQQWQVEMGERLVLRNRWTQGSARVDKASAGMPVARQQSRVGSLAGYVAETEKGGTRTGKGHVGKALPTTVASGEGRGGNVRRRMVRAGSRLGALQLDRERVGATPKQRNAVALAVARKNRKRVVFLEGSASSQGIYRIQPGRKNLKPTMLYNLGRKALHVKPHPTLEPTLAVMDRKFPRIATAAFLQQLKRLRAYGL